MGDAKQENHETDAEEFERLAGETQPGLIAEFWDFLRYNKKWWLTPIIVVLLLVGLLIVLSGSASRRSSIRSFEHSERPLADGSQRKLLFQQPLEIVTSHALGGPSFFTPVSPFVRTI